MARDGINKRAIAKMMRDIQVEFDKHPIRVAVEADSPVVPGSAGTTIYNGPVIHGDANGARLAWGNQTVHQTQNQTQQIAPGFEPLAQAVVRTLEQLPAVGLPAQEQQDAEETARDILTEVTEAEPDRSKIRRAVAALKGFVAPVAAGLAAGAEDGAREWATTAIQQLGTPF